MNKDMGNAPAHIYDWIAQHDFDALTAAQQQEVLQYIAAKEYARLRHASIALTGTKSATAIPGREAIKQELLQRMQQHSASQRKVMPLRQASAVWRAAAIVLFMLSCGLVYHITVNATSTVAEVRKETDTVYIARMVPGPQITQHDTVFLRQTKKQGKKMPKKQSSTAVATSADIPAHVPAMEINVMTPAEYEQRTNTGKGSSMKDDSLTKRYAFVTL